MTTRLPAIPLAVSLLLHALMAAPFLLPGKSGLRTTEVAFMDLTTETPATVTPPKKIVASPEPAARPKPAPPKAKRVVVKTPVPPVEESRAEEALPAEPQDIEGPAPQEIAAPSEMQQPPLVPPASAQNDLVLGMSRGFFQTLGSGRTLLPEVRDYYLAMLEAVNRRWWGEAVDHRNIRQEVVAVVIIDRNGLLLNGWIARSSGDVLIDQIVLNTIRGAAPFPPLPEEFATDYFQAPIRLVPPVAPDIAKPEVPPHGGIVPPT